VQEIAIGLPLEDMEPGYATEKKVTVELDQQQDHTTMKKFNSDPDVVMGMPIIPN
jgi:hypothetical protein